MRCGYQVTNEAAAESCSVSAAGGRHCRRLSRRWRNERSVRSLRSLAYRNGRELLSEHHSETELDRQLTRMRRAASALVRHTRREIDIVTHALLRYGTLDNDQIAELLAT
jgi:hypothetical protein